MKLLEKGTLLKEERNHARRLSRGIQGFGSFPQRSAPAQGILREKSLPITLGRCNSDLENNEDNENKSTSSNNGMDTASVKTDSHEGGLLKSLDSVETKRYQDDLGETVISSKENLKPSREEFHLWNLKGESRSLLDCGEDDSGLGIFGTEDNHPFNSTTEMHVTASLVSC